MNRHGFVAALLVSAALAVAAGEAPPSNDRPDGATTFASVPFAVEQDLRGATLDAAEEPACGDDRDDVSVWFAYEPNKSHRLVLDTAMSSGDADLAVFESGAAVDCDDEGFADGAVDALLHVDVVAGRRYLVQVTAHDTDILRFAARTYEPFAFEPVVQTRGYVDEGTAYLRVATRCNQDSSADGYRVTLGQGVGLVGATGATEWLSYCSPLWDDGSFLPVVEERGGLITVEASSGAFVVGPVAVELAGVACNASPRYRECVEFDVSAVQLLRPFGTPVG